MTRMTCGFRRKTGLGAGPPRASESLVLIRLALASEVIKPVAGPRLGSRVLMACTIVTQVEANLDRETHQNLCLMSCQTMRMVSMRMMSHLSPIRLSYRLDIRIYKPSAATCRNKLPPTGSPSRLRARTTFALFSIAYMEVRIAIVDLFVIS